MEGESEEARRGKSRKNGKEVKARKCQITTLMTHDELPPLHASMFSSLNPDKPLTQEHEAECASCCRRFRRWRRAVVVVRPTSTRGHSLASGSRVPCAHAFKQNLSSSSITARTHPWYSSFWSSVSLSPRLPSLVLCRTAFTRQSAEVASFTFGGFGLLRRPVR